MFEPFNDFLPADYVFGLERKEARKRGLRYGEAELTALFNIWAQAALTDQAIHTADSVRLPTMQGGFVEITPRAVGYSGEPTPEVYRAAMQHMATQWGGRGVIAYDPNNLPTLEHRLRSLAYAQVYGIEMDDPAARLPGGKLTEKDLARIEVMTAQIRALHKDAPPAPQKPAQATKPAGASAPAPEPAPA